MVYEFTLSGAGPKPGPYHWFVGLERETGLEPATLCLGRLGFAIRI